MAVIDITESWAEREVNETYDSRTAVRTFTVKFDNNDNPIARPILALTARDPATGLTIPQLGHQHPYDRFLYVKNRKVKTYEGAFVYEVTCDYSTISTERREKTPDPLKQKPGIRWTFVTNEERIDRDIKGVAITNSAKQSFDPPITKPIHDLALQYDRNDRYFSPTRALKYKGKVNSDTFLGAPPGTVMCTIFDADKVYDEENGDYYHVTFEFQFRLEEVLGKRYGWLRRILDEGYYEESDTEKNEDGTPKLIPIKDDNSQHVVVPVKLDGNGGILKVGADDFFKTFELYDKISFSDLGIRI